MEDSSLYLLIQQPQSLGPHSHPRKHSSHFRDEETYTLNINLPKVLISLISLNKFGEKTQGSKHYLLPQGTL